MTTGKESNNATAPVTADAQSFSLHPIDIDTNFTEIPIAKSYNGSEKNEDENDKGSDTFGGRKYVVRKSTYLSVWSINSLNAKKTNFTNKDIEILKEALIDMFTADASAARPSGTMYVSAIYWREYDKVQYTPSSIFKKNMRRFLLNAKSNSQIKDFFKNGKEPVLIHCLEDEDKWYCEK